jgi:hypothetical protein
MTHRAVFGPTTLDANDSDETAVEVVTAISSPAFKAATRGEVEKMVADAYRTGSSVRFADAVWELATDPLIPVEKDKRRPVRPVLLTTVIGLCLIVVIIFCFFYSKR